MMAGALGEPEEKCEGENEDDDADPDAQVDRRVDGKTDEHEEQGLFPTILRCDVVKEFRAPDWTQRP
jgi:hypothetical protein